MTYLFLYVVFSYVAWYFLMICDDNASTIGRWLFWFAPLLLPVVLLDKFVLRKL